MMRRRSPASSRQATEQAEAAHWDGIAVQHGAACAAARLGAHADPLHSAHMAALGPLLGRTVLEVGCGMGVLTTELASGGADVTALDISAESLGTVAERAASLAVSDRVHLVQASAHALPCADGSFDLVTGRFILHHLDVASAAAEIARVLKPGGRAVFTENSARSRLLMSVRKHLCGRFGIPKWSTPGEHPLRDTEMAQLRACFARMTILHPRFDWFFLLNAKLFAFRNPRATRILDWLDRGVPAILPFMRGFAYYQVIVLER